MPPSFMLSWARKSLFLNEKEAQGAKAQACIGASMTSTQDGRRNIWTKKKTELQATGEKKRVA